MVEVGPFIQQKCVTEAEKKQGRAQAVEKTGRNKQPEHAQDCPVNIHPVARPRLDPGESIILEEKWRFNPLGRDPTMRVVPPNLPSHEKAECDSEKNQRSDVDWRERLLLQVRYNGRWLSASTHGNCRTARVSAFRIQVALCKIDRFPR